MRNRIRLILLLCLATALLAGCTIRLGGKGGEVVVGEAELIRGEYTPGDASSLSIITTAADVTVETGDVWRVEYALPSEPEITENGGRLTIEDTSDRAVINIDFTGINAPKVTVTVPESAALTALEITSHVGDVRVRGLSLETLSAEVNTGDLSLSDITAAGAITMQSNTGDQELRRVQAPKITVTGNTGEIDLEDVEAGHITARTQTGDIEMTLPGRAEDYSLDLKTSIGNVEINDREHENPFTTTNGGKTLTASSSVGDVEVEFLG